MELSQDVVEDVRKRLRRIAGQVQGVERMLVEGKQAEAHGYRSKRSNACS